MGPVGPDGVPIHRHRGRDVKGAAAETERVLHVVQRNLVRVTHQVTMVAREDLPEEMQCHVVGVPWDWVWLFMHVSNVAIYFLAAHVERAR